MVNVRQTLTSIQTKTWLMYIRKQSALYFRISVNIMREVCEYLSATYILPSVYENTLVLHDLEEGFSIALNFGLRFTDGTVFCFYQSRLLLGAGGDPPSKEVWSFDIDTEALVPLQNMAFARAWPGILNFQERVYVFGGSASKPLQACEVMHAQTEQWRRLTDMHSPKVAFSPLLHQREIYLMCPMPTECPFEVFNPASEIFRALPTSIVSSLYGCVSFLAGDSIKLITYSKELFTLGFDCIVREKVPVDLEGPDSSISNTPVVSYLEQVWWVNYTNGRVVRFDLASNSIREFKFDSPVDQLESP